MDEHPSYVLDAFAFMAYIQGEPAAQSVKKILQDAEHNKCHIYMSIINVGEVLYNVERSKSITGAQDILTLLQDMPIEILPADNATVLAAARVPCRTGGASGNEARGHEEVRTDSPSSRAMGHVARALGGRIYLPCNHLPAACDQIVSCGGG